MNCHIIKIGGSVLTEKGDIPSFNTKNASRMAGEIADCYKDTILVHGTGSYGKPPAIKYAYNHSGRIENNSLVALEIKRTLLHLNQLFVESLHSAGIPAISFHIQYFINPKNLDFDYDKLKNSLSQFLNQRVLPVIYGDLIPLSDGSFSVLSSDRIVYELAKCLHPNSVAFLTSTDGVYLNSNENAPILIENLNSKTIQHIHRSPDDLMDVSGGMMQKARYAIKIAGYTPRCFIGSGYTPNILRDIKNNQPTRGTYVTV